MDDKKLDLLRELLADPDTRETLKKILVEEKPQEPQEPQEPEGFKNLFVDDLTVATVTKLSDGTEVNLIELQNKIPTREKKVRPRPKKTKKKCELCLRERDFFFGYACDECLRSMG